MSEFSYTALFVVLFDCKLDIFCLRVDLTVGAALLYLSCFEPCKLRRLFIRLILAQTSTFWHDPLVLSKDDAARRLND